MIRGYVVCNDGVYRNYFLPREVANVIDQAAILRGMSKPDIVSDAVMFRYKLEVELSKTEPGMIEERSFPFHRSRSASGRSDADNIILLIMCQEAKTDIPISPIIYR